MGSPTGRQLHRGRCRPRRRPRSGGPICTTYALPTSVERGTRGVRPSGLSRRPSPLPPRSISGALTPSATGQCDLFGHGYTRKKLHLGLAIREGERAW